MTICPNCGLEGDGNYCSNCGQGRGQLTPTVLEWISEAVEELFTLDAKLPQSLRRLAWPPGELTLEWRRGRRAGYVSPLRMYLASAFLFFLVWPYTPLDSALGHFVAAYEEGYAVGSGNAAAIEQGIRTDSPSVEATVRRITASMPAALLALLVPVFAALLYAVDGGAGRFVESLIAALHIHTVVFIFFLAICPFDLALRSKDTWENWIAPFLILALVLHVVLSVARVYETTPARACGRVMVVMGIYLVVALLAITSALPKIGA